MSLRQQIKSEIGSVIKELFNLKIEELEIQQTRKGFDGEYTLVVFPLVKQLKKNPAEIAQQIGEKLKENQTIVDFNVEKGFLNLSFSDSFFLSAIHASYEDKNYGFSSDKEKSVMIEYASPNTNKPIHLGHIRNLLLGFSIAEIQKASGKDVKKIQVINDRGIHICKSMLAWQKFGNGETPESAKMKGDHLVGKYYVEFDKAYKKEIQELIAKGKSEEEAKKEAPLLIEAQEMLRKWEANNPEVRELWAKMNGWVYDGFDKTFERIGADFDAVQYESNTYLLGKELIDFGLQKKIFYKKEDGSVWCDLQDEGLDEKILQRADGTAVYITQDLGTAVERFEKFPIEHLSYVVGNEQDYHFKVLFLILKKLGFDWANSMKHLSYGMVELPEGKMKSREGTVVDADDLMDEMQSMAREISTELGDRLDGYSEEEKSKLFEQIGLGALKYYILKVDPKKRILFDPKESIQFNGDTGPFIQYTHARIQSILRRAEIKNADFENVKLSETEKQIIIILNDYSTVIQKASNERSPALIANYVYDLVKAYNQFYQNHRILDIEDLALKSVRLKLSQWVANVVASSLGLLGISAPERM